MSVSGTCYNINEDSLVILIGIANKKIDIPRFCTELKAQNNIYRWLIN